MGSRALFLIGTVLVGATAGAYLALRTAEPGTDQPPPERALPRAPAAADIVRIRGRVLDPFDNPVSDCSVSCAPELPAVELDPAPVRTSTVRTGADGRFELSMPMATRPFALALVHPRFPVTISERRSRPSAAGTIELGDLVLDSGSGITATVRDATSGAPVVGARVTATPAAESGRLPIELTGLRIRSALSDARGVAVVEGMQAGQYGLRVEADGYATELAQVEHHGVDVIPFRLEVGQVVRGEVVTAAGAPLAGATVRAICARTGLALETVTRSGGGFRLPRVATGRHTLVVDTVEHGSAARSDVVVPSPVPVTIAMPAPVELRGRVRAERETTDRVKVELSGSHGPHAFVRTALADADGAFTFPGIPPGRYRLRASSERPRLGDTIDVELPCDPLEIALRPLHRIRGRIFDPDGAPLAGARLSIMPADRADTPIRRFERRARRAFECISDRTGEFEIEIAGPSLRHRLTVDGGDTAWSSAPVDIAPGRAPTEGAELLLSRLAGGSHATLTVRFEHESSYLVASER